MESDNLDDIDVSLQHLKDLTQALEARLQQRGSELQQLSQVLSRHGTTHDEGPSHAGSSPSADGRAVATEQHGLSAAVHRHAYEVASVQPSSESNTAHTAFPTPATGAGAAWPPPGSLNNTAAAADEQEQDAWSEDSGSLEFDSSLLEMAGEQSTPYSLLTEVIEAAGSVPHQQTRRKAAIPVWRQQLQQELQQQHARQRQDAHIAATAGQQLHASQQEAVWRAMQGQLPFCTAGGKVPETKHKLQKSLDHMLGTSGSRAHFPAIAAEQPRTASEASQARARSPPGEQVNDLQAASMSEVTTAAPQQSTSSNSNPTKAKIVVPLLDRYIQTAAAQATLHNAQQPADVAPVSAGLFQHASLPVDTLSAQHTIGTPPARSIKAAAGGTSPSHRSSPKRKIPSKQNEWAAADAATNAELTAYLKEHWQQQYICAAALVLQCAWRSRGPRVNYNRYMSVRQHHVAAAVGPAFSRWHLWAQAGKHHRQQLQRRALIEWKDLLALQLELCRKVVRGLQRGALCGDMAGLLTWRMCAPLGGEQSLGVKPSLGGLLANMLKQKAPRMRQQAYFGPWLRRFRQLQATRAKAAVLLSAAALRWQQESARDCLRFWVMYTTTRVCERLRVALPAFRPQLPEFEEWLWRHERAKHLKRQASALFGRSCLRRCFVAWRRYVYKVHTMRLAWTGLMLVSPSELVRHGVSAFKANWKEEKHRGRLLRSCCRTWLEVSKRNKNVAIMRRRIQQAYQHQAKCAVIRAFKRHTNMSLLISTAGTIKIWQARPLVLAHLHAWMGDSLHMTFYLLWTRWRRRALARLRFRAAVGLHMYRAHWLERELAFTAWRKVAAVARPSKLASGQGHLQRRHTGGATLIILGEEDSNSSSGVTAAACTSKADAHEADVQPNAVYTLLQRRADIPSNVRPTASLVDVPGQQQQQPEQRAPSEESSVFVSLADFPVGLPWRPLARRADVMARRGLQHLSGARLAKVVRDLRELEGRYIIKDHDRGAEGLLGSMVYNKRRAVSPGLKGIATAQLPMNTLWQATCPEDAIWWQRVVGLVQQHVPHPDSWKCFISSFSTTKPSSSGSSSTHSCDRNSNTPSQTGQPRPFELHELLHGSCCRVGLSQGTQQHLCVKSSSAADAAAARSVKSSEFKVTPLQLASKPSNIVATLQRATVVTDKVARVTDSSAAVPAAQRIAAGIGQRVQVVTSDESGSDNHPEISDSTSGIWPSRWTAENIAWLCQLVQAEELLETAVHLLLGVGSDSSEELYLKLGQMTRGQALDMQGDRLTWLLSTAVAHDITHARGVLLKARARDELMNATMEMRQRAVALHLHFPWKFTLDSRRPVTDVQAVWSEIVRKVEAERDWEASSSDDDDNSFVVNSINLQQLGASQAPQQLEFSIPGTDIQPLELDQQQIELTPTPKLVQIVDMNTTATGDAGGRNGALPSTSGPPSDQAGTAAASPFFTRSGQDSAALSEEPGTPRSAHSGVSRSPSPLGRLSPGPPGTAAVALATGGAFMAAGSLSTALSPGGMLDQTMGSGDLQLHHASTAATPATGSAQAQHLTASIQLQEEMFRIEQLRRQQKAQLKQQQQHQAAMTAAKGLFGTSAVGRAAAPAATYQNAAAAAPTAAAEQGAVAVISDVFTMPMYASTSGAHSGRSSKVGSLSGSQRSVAATALVQSNMPESQQAAGAEPSHSRELMLHETPQIHPAGAMLHDSQQPQQQQQRRAVSSSSHFSAGSPSPQAPGSASKTDSGAYTSTAVNRRPGSVPNTTRPHSSRLANTSRRSEAGVSSRAADQIGIISAQSNSTATAPNSTLKADVSGLEPLSSSATHISSNEVAADIKQILRAELPTVLQSVLVPDDDAAGTVMHAQQVAAELAEACGQWVIEQQHQLMKDMHTQQQQQAQQQLRLEQLAGPGGESACLITEQDSRRHESAASAALHVAAEPVSVVQGVAVQDASGSGSQAMGTKLSIDGAQTGSTSEPGPRSSSRPASAARGVRPKSSNSAHSNTSVAGVATAAVSSSAQQSECAAAALSAAVQAALTSSTPAKQAAQRAALNAAGAEAFISIPSSAALSVSGLGEEERPAQDGRAIDSSSHLQSRAHVTGQQQQLMMKQLSSSSSTSSLPSIPSCAEFMQQIKQQTGSQHQKRGKDTQLPALTGHGCAPARQQPSKLDEGEGAHAPIETKPSIQDTAAGPAIHAVWRSPANATPKPATPAAAATTAAVLASQGTPALLDLLQDAAQDDWQQFEVLAQELASGLTAALQARHNKPVAGQTALDAAAAAKEGLQLAPQQAIGEAVQQQEQDAMDEPDVWCSQPDVPAAAVAAPAADLAAAATTAEAEGPGPHRQQPDLAGMVSKLMTAPLAARFIFWKKIVQRQQSAPALGGSRSTEVHAANQLHHLAWSTLLQQPAPQQRPQNAIQPASPPLTAATAAAAGKPAQLEAKLKQYLQAHTQWRAGLATTGPLAPAEKWISLQHEEMVLDFITSLTVPVYMDLLRKHRGMTTLAPAAKQSPQPVLAFGSTALKMGSSRGPLQSSVAAAGASVKVKAQGRQRRPIQAEGRAVAQVEVAVATRPLQASRMPKSAPMIAVPGPAVLPDRVAGHGQQEQQHNGADEQHNAGVLDLAASQSWAMDVTAATSVACLAKSEGRATTQTRKGCSGRSGSTPAPSIDAAQRNSTGDAQMSSAGGDANSWSG